MPSSRTALIERKFGVGEAKYFTTGLQQARSANEDHFATGITFATANQKRARNVKRTIKTSDTLLLCIKLVESFAIATLNALIDCEFLFTHCSLLRTTLSLVASPSLKNLRTTAIHHFIARKSVLTIRRSFRLHSLNDLCSDPIMAALSITMQ